jgi:hypothetical protein
MIRGTNHKGYEEVYKEVAKNKVAFSSVRSTR